MFVYGRINVLIMGGMVAAAGAWSLYSDTTHWLRGKSATATLIEHVQDCTIEYQRVGESKRKEPMACAAAEAIQSLVGATKVRIYREAFALVRFSLADGRIHDAKVAELKLRSQQLPVGTELAVVYAPDQPGDVRRPVTWDDYKVSLLLLFAGLALMSLVSIGRIARLLVGSFAGRASPAGTEPRPTVADGGHAALPAMGSEPSMSFGRRK